MALKFGKKIIYPVQIFFQNSLVFCFVNLKPVVPGHILISPIRNVSKISELTEQESCELWLRVKSVSEIIENHYKVKNFFLIFKVF